MSSIRKCARPPIVFLSALFGCLVGLGVGPLAQRWLGGTYPGMTHAGCYAVTLHYLKAVAALGAASAKKSGALTVAKMKELPSDDNAFGPGSIRIDGRAALPAYLLQVKTPGESKGPWDYCKVVSTASATEATKPLNEVGCYLVKT